MCYCLNDGEIVLYYRVRIRCTIYASAARTTQYPRQRSKLKAEIFVCHETNQFNRNSEKMKYMLKICLKTLISFLLLQKSKVVKSLRLSSNSETTGPNQLKIRFRLDFWRRVPLIKKTKVHDQTLPAHARAVICMQLILF